MAEVQQPTLTNSSSRPDTQNASLPSTHDQTTLPLPTSNGSMDAGTKPTPQYEPDLLAPTPPIRTPRDTSPDTLSPQTSASRQLNGYRRGQVLGSRLAQATAVDGVSSPTMKNASETESTVNGMVTPAARKSVQFSRDTQEIESPAGENVEPIPSTAEQNRTQSLYAKLRALAISQGFAHTRSTSAPSPSARTSDGKELDGQLSLNAGREFPFLSATLEEEADSDVDADADAEDSGREGMLDQSIPRKKRKTTRPFDQIETAPASPHSVIRQDYPSAPLQPDTDRPKILPRRATDTDMNKGRQAVSDDEGRKQAGQGSSWAARHALRGLSYGTPKRAGDTTPEGRDGRRPLTLRGFTSFAGSRDPDEVETPRGTRRKLLSERSNTASAARWDRLKTSLKLLGQSKKKERTQDHEKSAELLAELAAGSPAALMLASMFQRDEHDNKRIPILLEQLKVKVTDSEVDRSRESREPENVTPGERHLIFRIELEYGNGINRMRWVIKRSLRDFANLHLKYRLHYGSEKLKGRGDNSKDMPKFPKSAFPYLKNFKTMDDEEDEEEEVANETDGAATDGERPHLRAKQSSFGFGLTRRKSSIAGIDNPTTPGGLRKEIRFAERQRKALELYLQRMIKFFLFKADSNRLCKFLEVSALGMRLAAEGSYHGKEGYLLIRSAKGLDFRNALTPANLRNRHTPKWFLVRHSYVVCVDSPEEMHIYDVFLFDPDFRIQSPKPRSTSHTKAHDLAVAARESAKHPQHHRLKLYNSERRLKLLARNERQLNQFEESIQAMVAGSPWTNINRFESFAPVRPKCFAQWLVDGRDHMWVVSRALSQAKDVIYIHDWWLSPELYMRRPAAISQKWRLDRLLKRKAEEGVKVFVIVYRNIESAVPIDSQYTKFSLLDLHPNIFVQRSPNQFRQNTFFWAHHEKLVIVDHTLAFVGGIDLCFGRWDTPQHTLIDDKPTGFAPSSEPKDADHCQLWPGKDYSNPRVQDFYALNKPYEEMYDRQKVARMPWHDISMQVVGQPARDLTRHFVQRWNYILRQRKPTRPTPFLLPPPDFVPADLEALGLDGTCEVQILRSAGPWSLGTPEKTEHSIMNAYIKLIEESEHFVYMENQFFISSCETEGATVHNKIGDALVERIIRAAKSEEAWRAVIVIPLIPGFQNTVEQEGGTSVRLIMQYQYRSICRGESSIFGRLRSSGIEPNDYIQFYSLRQWGRLGPRKALVTEQLYIHAKCMIVDDRVCIIGSANINERSMLGNRDSECAAVVRDADMVNSRMNGKPYKVGRFPHTLRMRLMREHLGLDVDAIMEDAQAMENEHIKSESASKGQASQPNSPVDTRAHRQPNAPDSDNALNHTKTRGQEVQEELLYRADNLRSFNHDVDWEQADNPNLRSNRKLTEDHRVTGSEKHKQDIEGKGVDKMLDIEASGQASGRDTVLVGRNKEVLIADQATEGRTTLQAPRKHGDIARLPSYVIKMETPEPPMPPRPPIVRMHTEQLGLPMLSQLPALPVEDDSDIGGPALAKPQTKDSSYHQHPLMSELRRPLVDRDCMTDPVHDAFMDDIWHRVAENNTKIYRAVFRCMPDNQVRDWNDYHQYMAYEQRFNQLQGNEGASDWKVQQPSRSAANTKSGPPGTGSSLPAAQLKSISKIPGDIEKRGQELKNIVKDALHQETDDNVANVEKEQIRMWAAEANQAQVDRIGKPLHRQESTSDEKAMLATVPEAEDQEVQRPVTAGGLGAASDDDSTERATSSQGTATAEREKTPTSTSGTGTTAATVSGNNNNNNNSSEATTYSTTNQSSSAAATTKRRRRGTTRSSRRDFNASDDILSVEEAEELLGCLQGQLVIWPYDWLERVEAGSNWLFPFDQISPIEIYI